MKTRTIAGDIRRIRSLMRLGPDIGSCVIRRGDYGELHQLFDAIEAKAKMMKEENVRLRAAINKACEIASDEYHIGALICTGNCSVCPVHMGGAE